MAHHATPAHLAHSGRPLPLRTYSEYEPESPVLSMSPHVSHTRHKSTSMNVSLTKLMVPAESRMGPSKPRRSVSRRDSASARPNASRAEALTPPATPSKAEDAASTGSQESSKILQYDFSRIDYELERARLLGSGLWSNVYLTTPARPQMGSTSPDVLTPPVTPQKGEQVASVSVYAVKVPARPDASEVFQHEARMLTTLHRHADAAQYVVPFYGLDPRNSALVFEAVVGGSLEDLIKRMKQMTEVARHTELVSIFPRLAHDLVSGLDFIHEAGIIHADIKTQNVLLDISDHYSLPAPVIRARYIDFSAAFQSGEPDAAANAGGTWEFMAPEQLRIQKDLNTPTFKSDVFSLGISLLSVIILGSPYAAACGGNAFMLREAIKGGDPLGFARMDPRAHKRMAACQEFIDCCRLALQKDRDRRSSATAWKGWLESKQHGVLAY